MSRWIERNTLKGRIRSGKGGNGGSICGEYTEMVCKALGFYLIFIYQSFKDNTKKDDTEVIIIEEKSCRNCRNHVVYIGGVDMNFKQRPNVHECTESDLPYDLFDKYKIENPGAENDWWDFDPDILHKKCGRYKPRKVEKCLYCEKKMDIPVIHVKHYAVDPHGKIPVCSEECRKTLQEEIKEYLRNCKNKEGWEEKF